MEAPDFHLPDEVLAVIPTDPYDQLDLARKITSMAIASRVSNLESETSRLKQKVSDQDRHIFELEEKASCLQQVFQEADSRLKLVLDENMKLVQERDSLSATVKKLNRDLGKLETFKRQLMQSLSEDSSTETVDIGTCDQAVPRAYPDKAVKQTGQRFSLTPYQITPRLTPTGTPKVISTTGSPKSYSAVGSPQKDSGATTPTKMQYDGRTSLSSWYPSSQRSSAANSPPRARALPSRTPRIDGKEFFRQARSRLSYEQFSAFLANIKQLNDHKQSREETLRKAEEILGTDNKDLYLSFQGLLNRNVN
ncbi:uncharacterized protein At4g15545-like isoform X2 [Chenopodium quinoa]|uniref:uncharacterized protein At4g15545-like isoform X2 n=1 Tax=Chenopodium quinoa TaxID=63459 RepID=UPI000B774634|nr:uncharacterized protein At4g15545-like isoform X2 [Chenopodium quinoa]